MSDGVGRELAASFLESVAGYGESPAATPPSEDRPVKLGTVDPSWTTGNPRVLFDGESIMGVRGYPWAGVKPRPGDRVVLLPQGRSFVIIGALASVPGASLPTGTIIEGVWSSAPTGFLLLDGTVQVRATYPALFAVIGTTYNTGGETSAQFRLPDFRGRTLVGLAASGQFGTMGAKVGAQTHTLTVAEMPSHTHEIDVNGTNVEYGNTNAGAGTGYGGFVNPGVDIKATARGGGGAHNNVQPSAVVQRAVRY